jgi:Kdo2-lipid IVA lauroyltransferase/acyltransferase
VSESRASAISSPKRRRARSRQRHAAELFLFRLAAGILTRLPGAARESLTRRLARLSLRFGRSRRHILFENLAIALPDLAPGEIERLARESVEAVGVGFVEFLELSELSEDQIRARVRVVGEDHLRAARARGKGVFLLSAHFGGWEIGAIRAGLIDEPIASVVRPLDNPLLERELARRRTRLGNRLIAKRDAARDILRALRQGGTVAILVDQNVLEREAVFVPFFGRLAATTPALALFQLKTGAAVVPSFCWAEGGGRYRLEFEKPIYAEEFRATSDRDEAVRKATARYTEVTEAVIRKAPAAWLWMHNRWRTRPPASTY